MKQPKPFWKKSHKCWYVQRGDKQIRLDPDKEKAWQMYHKIMAGEIVVGQDERVVDVIRQFLDWSEGNHEPDTYRFYQVYNASFSKSLPKDLKVKDLKAIHLTRWVDKHWPAQEVSRNGKVVTPAASPSTRHGAMRAVQRGFNWAEEQDLIDRNPLKKVRKPKPVNRDTYLWPEQYDQLLKLAKDECFRDFMEILRHTGCRPQAARIVEARWFNRKERCWMFPLQGVPQKMRGRTILLNDVAFEITERLAARNPEGPMFRNGKGRPWTKNALDERCRRLRTKVDFYVTPYTIRHTFATDSIIREVDLVSVAELMGHKDLRMLSQIYQHVEKRRDHLRACLDRATSHVSQAARDDSGNGDGEDAPLKIVG